MPRNKHNRYWERVAVVHWLFLWVVAPKRAVCVFECLSANLALQEFFQAINFRFTRTTKHQHSAFNNTRHPPELRRVLWRESPGILCHVQVKLTEQKGKINNIENNSQFSTGVFTPVIFLILSYFFFRFILSLVVFFLCLFRTFHKS